MSVSLFYDNVHIFLAYGNDDLFSRWIFSSYIDFWPNLLIVVESNIMYFNDFLDISFGKTSLILRISSILPLVA